MHFQSESVADEPLGAYDVLVEAEASVISAGTELAGYTALDRNVYTPGSFYAYPFRPGYGMIGKLLEVGGAVTQAKAGDRVLCMAKHASLQRYSVAPNQQPWHNVYPIGDALDGTVAAMIRMALVAYTAPQNATVHAGDTVVVIGLGVIGNIAAQLFQIGGARVIGIDTLPQRCEYARRVGIETVLTLAPDDQVAAIRDLTGGRGAEVVVDAVGQSRIIETAVFACANYGQVILLGSPRASVTMDVTPMLSHIHLHYITVRGALEWQNPPRSPAGNHTTIEGNIGRLKAWIEAGRLDVETLISDIIAPNQLPEMFAALAQSPQDHMGVIVDWRQLDQNS